MRKDRSTLVHIVEGLCQPFWRLANALNELHRNSNEESNDPRPTKKPPILRNEVMSG